MVSSWLDGGLSGWPVGFPDEWLYGWLESFACHCCEHLHCTCYGYFIALSIVWLLRFGDDFGNPFRDL